MIVLFDCVLELVCFEMGLRLFWLGNFVMFFLDVSIVFFFMVVNFDLNFRIYDEGRVFY